MLLDYIMFRDACDYYLKKLNWRRAQRGAELAAVNHVLPPPVGGRTFILESGGWWLLLALPKRKEDDFGARESVPLRGCADRK